ncbi:MAG TPA: mechanosensitive ion channel domain-containing protein [Novosphingobium sp.]|nr:mechanosensitive ion channel domain-containing protein [Novosphingobium sp.]HZV09862.1 mechanosensitive ion channel domain-containing protein [Novosphingobium sp.]
MPFPLFAASGPVPLPTPTLDTDALPSFSEFLHWSHRLTHSAIVAGVAVAIALVLHKLVFAMIAHMVRRGEGNEPTPAARRLHRSTRWLLVGVALSIADDGDWLVAHLWGAVARFVMPALTGWVVYALVSVGAEVLAARADRVDDELAIRSRRTRIALLARSAGFVIIFITLSLILFGIPAVRHLGATLMASAGLLGLAVGAAAQPMLKSLIAGLQIALTEPIRLGDYVVVDGESGRVEDIHLSYVVVQTSDERRLIVPPTKFLDATFQNWSRVGGIAGPVVIPVRPGTDIAPIRAAFLAMLQSMPEWDGRVGSLYIADVRPGVVELRLLVSAAQPTLLGALRPAVREGMMSWLQANAPDALCQEAE